MSAICWAHLKYNNLTVSIAGLKARVQAKTGTQQTEKARCQLGSDQTARPLSTGAICAYRKASAQCRVRLRHAMHGCGAAHFACIARVRTVTHIVSSLVQQLKRQLFLAHNAVAHSFAHLCGCLDWVARQRAADADLRIVVAAVRPWHSEVLSAETAGDARRLGHKCQCTHLL